MKYLDITIDRHTLHRGPHSARLSPAQFKLASFLIGQKGVPVPGAELISLMWGNKGQEFRKIDNRLSILIARVRRELYLLGLTIVFEKGKGYHITDKLHEAAELLRMRHYTHINIHCSMALREAINAEAKRRGLSKSDLMRFILADALGIEEKPAKIGGDHSSPLFREANREVA